MTIASSFRLVDKNTLENIHEATLEILAEPIPEGDNQQAANHRAKHHGQPGQAPLFQRVAEQLFTLLEYRPMHELDGLAERVIAQAAEQANDHRKDDQEGVFTEAKRTLQGVQEEAQPFEKPVYPGRH